MRHERTYHSYLRPGSQLNANVRAGFIRIGESLNNWCSNHGYHHGNVRKALVGEWRGDKANLIIDEIAGYLAKRGVNL